MWTYSFTILMVLAVNVVTQKDKTDPLLDNELSTKHCTLPADTGPCRARIPRWYYAEDGVCKIFTYGGCAGNENNFRTEKQCISESRTCKGKTDVSTRRTTDNDVFSTLPAECMDEMSKGFCRANFRRWFFNKTSCQCEQFIYGGCFGSANKFTTKEKCEQRCVEGQPCLKNIPKETCSNMKKNALCLLAPPEQAITCSRRQRWYYDGKTCSCQPISNACSEDGNSFSSKENCESGCVKKEAVSENICQTPPELRRLNFEDLSRCKFQFLWSFDERRHDCLEKLYCLNPETKNTRGLFTNKCDCLRTCEDPNIACSKDKRDRRN